MVTRNTRRELVISGESESITAYRYLRTRIYSILVLEYIWCIMYSYIILPDEDTSSSTRWLIEQLTRQINNACKINEPQFSPFSSSPHSYSCYEHSTCTRCTQHTVYTSVYVRLRTYNMPANYTIKSPLTYVYKSAIGTYFHSRYILLTHILVSACTV